MKNLLVGSLVAYGTFALISSACSQTYFQVTCRALGTAQDIRLAPGIVSFDANGGLMTDSKLASDDEEDQVSLGPGSSSALAKATSGNGHITVYADASATASVKGIGAASATARAYYVDDLVLHSGAPGTGFHLAAFWNLSGEVGTFAGSTGDHPNNSVVHDVYATASSSLNIGGAGLEDELVLNPTIAFDQTEVQQSVLDAHFHTDPPKKILVTLEGIFGEPVHIEFGMDAAAGVNVSSDDIFNMYGGSAFAVCDFSHTLSWGGITSVTDANGLPVNDWTVTSGSGFDYSQAAAPEPSTFLQFAIALPSLLLARRHYRRSLRA